MPSPQELHRRLLAIEKLDLVTVIKTLLAAEDRTVKEADPVFQKSPAGSLSWADIQIIQNTPAMLKEVAKIPAGKDGRHGRDGKNGIDGKDGAPGAKGEKGDRGDPAPKENTQRIVAIARQEVEGHEERFDHLLLHPRNVLGPYVVDFDNAGPGKMMIFNEDGTKLIFVNPPQKTEIHHHHDENMWGAGLQGLSFINKETPSGSVNDSNVTFTLANTPVTGSVDVFRNGILQEPGVGNDYTISGSTITFSTAPSANAATSGVADRIRVSYRY